MSTENPAVIAASPEIVTRQKRLDALCHTCRAAGRFAFDTEFIRDDTYDAALCLVQIAVDGQVVLVDPAADLDVGVFWKLVCDPDVVTIVHAGKEDFDVCLRMTGRTPRNVFDVQIAAGFVGYGYPLSLSRLVNLILHKRIAKGQTLTDWLRRPLTDDQIRYAVEDVLYLTAMYEHLTQKIEAAGRTTWAREELARFESPARYRPPVQERLHRFKGSRTLDSLGLALLERLAEWRDRWAQQKNRPTRALMRDDVLVEIARRRPKRPSDLEVMRGFPQARNPRIIGEILEIIEKTRALPARDLPKPHETREEAPMHKAMLDLLSAVTRAICHEENLSNELLGSAQRLRDLIDHHKSPGQERPMLLTGWRDQFIGRRLVDLLEGRSELHVSGWPDNPRMQVVTHAPRRKPKSEP